MKAMKIKVGKIIRLILVIAISISLLLGIAGCNEEMPEPEPEFNLSYVVVDTGQEKCYDDSQEIACPQTGEAFYGQDAQYQGVLPSYQDNGDGTVTDLNTDLMWQKTPGDKVTYNEAMVGAGGFSNLPADTPGYIKS